MSSFKCSDSWSSSTHDNFVNSLQENNVEDVEMCCRQLVINMICFIYEIYATEELLEECEEMSYITRFVNSIFNLSNTTVHTQKIETLQHNVDFEALINNFKLYVHFCRIRISEDCSCHSHVCVGPYGELGIAIGILAKLEDFLRYEAMLLTTKWYRSMREFMQSPMNAAISRGIGLDIMACSEHLYCERRRPVNGSLPLDHVPCSLLFYHIATAFHVPVSKVIPDRSFDGPRRLAIAKSLVKIL